MKRDLTVRGKDNPSNVLFTPEPNGKVLCSLFVAGVAGPGATRNYWVKDVLGGVDLGAVSGLTWGEEEGGLRAEFTIPASRQKEVAISLYAELAKHCNQTQL